MTHEQIMDFGQRWHWPGLVLDKVEYLPHGRVYYEMLSESPEMCLLVEKRIQQWHERLARYQVDVDKVLKTAV